jgi:hypothetical protein
MLTTRLWGFSRGCLRPKTVQHNTKMQCMGGALRQEAVRWRTKNQCMVFLNEISSTNFSFSFEALYISDYKIHQLHSSYLCKYYTNRVAMSWVPAQTSRLQSRRSCCVMSQGISYSIDLFADVVCREFERSCNVLKLNSVPYYLPWKGLMIHSWSCHRHGQVFASSKEDMVVNLCHCCKGQPTESSSFCLDCK